MTKTNNLINLSRKSMNTTDDINSYIFCNKCNTILGFELKSFKDDENKKYNIKIPSEVNYYLLKKNIKERNNRNIIINLISFKENLLRNVKEQLGKIFNDMKDININIKINLTQLTKQNFEDFSKFYKKKEFDFTFIIHKMEGRIFLLGQNGYFNAVESCLIKKQNSNLYFILVSNEINDVKNNQIIEELIYEGGEERLQNYYKNDRIIFLDNYNLKGDITKKKEWFLNKIKEIYGNEDIDVHKKRYYIKTDKNIYIMDKRKIDNMIEYLSTNKEKKGLGCFS